MNVSTIVTKIVEPIPKYRLAAMSMCWLALAGAGGVVRDLGQHAVERRDQEVDAEARRDAREGRRDARQRMTADAQERDGPEGYQHQVAGVGGDAREDAEQHDDERQAAL